MFCPSCGNQNPENTRQCGRCGAQLQPAAKPQRFKGTMMMASTPEVQAAGRAFAPAGPPAAPPAGPDLNSTSEDMFDSPTIMQAPEDVPGAARPVNRASATQPHGSGNVNSTVAMDASEFGLGAMSPGPAVPTAPPPETGASTVAVDGSAFGLGGPQPPPQGPQGAWGAPPQQQQQQGPQGGWGAPPQQQQQQQPEISTGGIASTVAVDISQFGLGGGGPNPYGPPPGQPQQQQQQPPQNFGGGYAQPGMQPGMQQGMQPGMQQGWHPQPMSTLKPPPNSAPSGGNRTLLILGLVFGVLIILGGAVAAMFLTRR